MPARFYEELGDRLHSARIRKDYSLQDVAEKMGKSRKTILNWETGRHKIDMDVLSDLCGVLDLNVRELVDECTQYL